MSAWGRDHILSPGMLLHKQALRIDQHGVWTPSIVRIEKFHNPIHGERSLRDIFYPYGLPTDDYTHPPCFTV